MLRNKEAFAPVPFASHLSLATGVRRPRHNLGETESGETKEFLSASAKFAAAGLLGVLPCIGLSATIKTLRHSELKTCGTKTWRHSAWSERQSVRYRTCLICINVA